MATKLYEYHVDGMISDDRFQKLVQSYDDEEKQLIKRSTEINNTIAVLNEINMNTDFFINNAKKYGHLESLDPELIRLFVEKIIVFESEKVKGKRKQIMKIYYNGIGCIE